LCLAVKTSLSGAFFVCVHSDSSPSDRSIPIPIDPDPDFDFDFDPDFDFDSISTNVSGGQLSFLKGVIRNGVSRMVSAPSA
jgi:hypothetical protein